MKKSNRKNVIRIFYFLLFGGSAGLYLFWKFHLMPLFVYQIFPITIQKIEKSCLYLGKTGVCHEFMCRGEAIRIQDHRKLNGLQKQRHYLITGDILFRNQIEYCSGLNGIKDYYFDIDNISAAPTMN